MIFFLNFDPWWPQFWPEPKNDRNDFEMIFSELSNAAFRFSLRRPGAEIMGDVQTPPPPAGGKKSRGPAGRGLTRALLGLWISHRLLGGGGGRLNPPPPPAGRGLREKSEDARPNSSRPNPSRPDPTRPRDAFEKLISLEQVDQFTSGLLCSMSLFNTFCIWPRTIPAPIPYKNAATNFGWYLGALGITFSGHFFLEGQMRLNTKNVNTFDRKAQKSGDFACLFGF